MIAQDIIDLAKYSEIGSLAIKEDNAALLLFMNMGMLELYKRFPIKTEEFIIELIPGTTIYDLPENFMYGMSAHGEIEEGSEKISSDLPINDEDEPESIFFPSHTQVQIPETATGEHISLIYVAKPTKITVDTLDQEVELPDTLVEALTSYIGYRAHMSVRGDGNAENNAHWVRFDRSCKKARELGVAYPIDSWRMIERIIDRGFA